MGKNKDNENLHWEMRKNTTAKKGVARRLVRKPNGEDVARGKDVGEKIKDVNAELGGIEPAKGLPVLLDPTLAEGLGPVPSGREAKANYRRKILVKAIEVNQFLDKKEREVLNERFGIGQAPKTLFDVAKKRGLSRSEIRDIEAQAVRKVSGSTPGLGELLSRNWLDS